MFVVFLPLSYRKKIISGLLLYSWFKTRNSKWSATVGRAMKTALNSLDREQGMGKRTLVLWQVLSGFVRFLPSPISCSLSINHCHHQVHGSAFTHPTTHRYLYPEIAEVTVSSSSRWEIEYNRDCSRCQKFSSLNFFPCFHEICRMYAITFSLFRLIQVRSECAALPPFPARLTPGIRREVISMSLCQLHCLTAISSTSWRFVNTGNL